MPTYAVGFPNTLFSITIPITRYANERVPIAQTAANGDSSTAATYVAAPMTIALWLSLVAAA
jgi:hypothetical protein